MVIYGKNPVFEAVNAGAAQRIYIRKGAALYDMKFDLPVQILGKQEFDARFNMDSQGIAADVNEITPLSLDEAMDGILQARGVVIMDRIQDPHNYGAIIRSAHCFGVSHIIVPRYHQAPITPTVVKSSAGSIFYSTIIEETNLASVCDILQNKAFRIVCCDIDTDKELKDISKDGKIALIVGSEGRGIREGLVKAADEVVKIPMYGKINSLNAAQSAAIAFYELFSQQ